MGNFCSSEGGWFPWCGSKCSKKKLNIPAKPEPIARPKPVVALDASNTDYLAIKKWNFELSKNGEAHHTDSYEQMKRESKPELVVRRGQKFLLSLETNVPYDAKNHKISFIFFVKDAVPNYGNGTQVGVLVDAEDVIGNWKADIKSQSETQLQIEISTSAKAIVGKWSLEVDTEKDGKTQCFNSPSDIYILFNPWCEKDQVYIGEESHRVEYVEETVGFIWRGTHRLTRPCPWQFAQYDKDVLDCVLYMLDKICRISASHRGDVLKVVRAISAGINSPDDSGVLVGNWSGEYEGGRSPTDWRGSLDIFQQFYKTKKPVKYGQCWVFSGVATTACRTLGIPCRPVTNFSSAHDTHNSLTIDHFYGEDGEAIEDLNSDSVWNFHVWNEIWSTRSDLGSDYNGWQVIDATPQEESDGQFRCGPTSLVSVKRGMINHPYDCPFVYAEVNADTLYWKYRGERQPMKLLGKKTGGVGLKLSTKAVGRYIREDITHLYKHEEESEAERKVMVEALMRCENTFARYYLNESFNDICFDLHLKDDITIGEPFTVGVGVTNKSDKEHSVSVILRVDTMLYTGAIKEHVKKLNKKFDLKAFATENVSMTLQFDDYYSKLVDQCAFNISCLGNVESTDYEFFGQDDFRVRKPDINLECLTSHEILTVGKESLWEAKFKNPLPMELTRARFYIMHNHGDSIYKKIKEPIAVGGTAYVEFPIIPVNRKDLTVTVVFTSKELEDVDGYINKEVAAKTESRPEPKETEVETALENGADAHNESHEI